MDQGKYLVYAVLIILVGAGLYVAIEKLTQTKSVQDRATLIDYHEPVDSLSVFEANGKKLFLSKCASCHGLFTKYDVHLLVGMEATWPDKKELFAFIRNPEEVIKRNAYAKKLKEVYSSTMPSFPDLTDQEIQSILDYITYAKKNNSKTAIVD